MELTIHGVERIQGRTKMLVKDVMELIATGAVVELGVRKNREYLLFYSRADKRTKIAIVLQGRTRLVTIYDGNFSLPSGIVKVSEELAQKAHDISQSFYRTRRAPLPVKEKKVRFFKVRLDVMEGKKAILSHDCGVIDAEHSGSIEKVLSFLEPQLSIIVPLVEAHREKDGSSVYYEILLLHEHSLSKAGRYKIYHKNLLKRPEGKRFLAATK